MKLSRLVRKDSRECRGLDAKRKTIANCETNNLFCARKRNKRLSRLGLG